MIAVHRAPSYVRVRASGEQFGSNRSIFKEGDPAAAFYIIIHGSVKVTVKEKDKAETLLANAHAGPILRRNWSYARLSTHGDR